MDTRNALAFVRRHGVVLESARGPLPSLAEAIAGEPIRGSWWGHPKGSDIYRIARRIRRSSAVLVCGLAGGRVTFVHRRLWPAFVRLAERFPASALDQIREVHTASGRHRRDDVPFPQWVSEETRQAAERLSEAEAARAIRVWLERYGIDRGAIDIFQERTRGVGA